MWASRTSRKHWERHARLERRTPELLGSRGHLPPQPGLPGRARSASAVQGLLLLGLGAASATSLATSTNDDAVPGETLFSGPWHCLWKRDPDPTQALSLLAWDNRSSCRGQVAPGTGGGGAWALRI